MIGSPPSVPLCFTPNGTRPPASRCSSEVRSRCDSGVLSANVGQSPKDDQQRDWWTPPAKLSVPKAFNLSPIQRGISRDGHSEDHGMQVRNEDRDGVRAKPEEVPTDRAGYVRSLYVR